MNPEVSTALERLDSILPLVAGLRSLSDEDAGNGTAVQNTAGGYVGGLISYIRHCEHLNIGIACARIGRSRI